MPIPTNFLDELYDQIDFALADTLGVMDQFALTPADVVNLAGGIPLPTITGIRISISSQYQGTLTVEIDTDQYLVIRIIDLDIRRIVNRVMVVEETDRGQGIGTHLFLNQVKAARQRHFIKILTYTRAPSLYDEDDQDWQGYYFWANFGVINTEVEEFNRWAVERNRSETTLNELMQTEGGRTLWKNEGFSWIGEFLFEEGNPCFAYLTAYLERKEIEWP